MKGFFLNVKEYISANVAIWKEISRVSKIHTYRNSLWQLLNIYLFKVAKETL